MKKLILFALIFALMVGIGCSSTQGPTVPDKDIDIAALGQIDLNNIPVCEYIMKDHDGAVIGYGKLGRAEDGSLYVIESRGAQMELDLTVLGLVNCGVSYNNPRGTAGNGLPYFWKGDTMEYDINIQSFFWTDIGTNWAKANIHTEMRRAYIYGSYIVLGELMLGDSTYDWHGIVPPGISMVEDSFYILPTQPSGNFATTVKLTSPIFFGLIEVIWFDGICGVFDP